jgi:hypothetical protein
MLVKSDDNTSFRYDIPAAAWRPGLSALVAPAATGLRGGHVRVCVPAAPVCGPWRPRRDIRLG